MRHTALALLAASSLLLCGAARAAMRPRYGGTLRVAMSAAPNSLDPVDLNQSGSLAGRDLSSLVFDTLTTLDDRGVAQEGLAVLWQAETGDYRWHLKLRKGVTFQDGTPCTADRVAASLRVANPSWKIVVSGDSVVIERDVPAPNLPSELALPRNAIVKRDTGAIVGTGPYSVSVWAPGKKLALAANNDYWGGRPFADAIEIDLGQNYRQQLLALDLGREDVIEVAPEQARHALAEGRRVESSDPVELMALVFARDAQSPEEARWREALALSIDRASLNNVILQGGGEPTGGLLPDTLTGYEFIFPTNADLAKARQARGEGRAAPTWTIGYDPSDSVARVIAERTALNAHDAGISLQLTNSPAADLRLVRVPLASLDGNLALAMLLANLGIPQPADLSLPAGDLQGLYAAENQILQSHRIIPLLHLRVSYGLSARVRNWQTAPGGGWQLSDVWIKAGDADTSARFMGRIPVDATAAQLSTHP